MKTSKPGVILLSAIFSFAVDFNLGQLGNGYEYSTETAEQYKEMIRHDMEHVSQDSETSHEQHTSYHERYNENIHDTIEQHQEGVEQTSEKYENAHEKYYSDSLGNRKTWIPNKGNPALDHRKAKSFLRKHNVKSSRPRRKH